LSGGTEEKYENFSQHSQSPGRDSKAGPPEYELGVPVCNSVCSDDSSRVVGHKHSNEFTNIVFITLMRFQVLTAAIKKIKALWDIELCSLGVDRRFRGAYCLRHQGDDGGSTHLRNVGLLQRDYMALYPRRL
jgi:hypothetical protein